MIANDNNAKNVLGTQLQPCCFEPKMGAKCCFQIWKKKNIKREIIEYPKTHKDFQFLKYGPKDEDGQPTPPEGADFALRHMVLIVVK